MTNVMRPPGEPAELRATATKLCKQYLSGLLTVTDLTMGLLEASDPWTEDFIGNYVEPDEDEDPEAIWRHLFPEVDSFVIDNVIRLPERRTNRRIRRLLGV